MKKRTAAIFAARLGGILRGPPPVPTAPRTPCLSAWAEPAPPPTVGFLGADPDPDPDPDPAAAGADARGLSAGGAPGEAFVAFTGDWAAPDAAVVGEEVDVDVDGAEEDDDGSAGCCSSETAPTRCSSCCTVLSAIPLVTLASLRASPSGSEETSLRPGRSNRT